MSKPLKVLDLFSGMRAAAHLAAQYAALATPEEAHR